MKTVKYFLFILLIVTISSAYAQPSNNDNWNILKSLEGSWTGEGSGKPGQGTGTFSFNFELNGNILVRKSHSEYPAANGKPPVIHDDIMIIYTNNMGEPDKAVYFDNEGHTLNYSISYSANKSSIIFTSENLKDTPGFRLTYTFTGRNVNIKFEMSSPGNPESYSTYLEGKAQKNNE